MALPRILLVEDDVSIRRLVEMSLDGMPIELITCEGAAQARERLRESPVRLLITDLMMPGETGLELLQSLERDPALRAGARLVVFSAGISPELERATHWVSISRTILRPVQCRRLTKLQRYRLWMCTSKRRSIATLPAMRRCSMRSGRPA